MIATLADGTKLTLPNLHIMLLSPPNCGKTHFSASAEKPELVLATDPRSKLLPYFDQGAVDAEIYRGQFGQPVWIVRSAVTGNAIIQVEGFYDEDDRNPSAMESLLSRLSQIQEEVRQKRWRTVVIDSWTQLEWIARGRRTHGAFSAGVDSPYLSAMDDLKSVVNARLMHLDCNLIVIFHIETKVTKNRKGEVIKDSRQDVGGGELSYGIQAIGQLKNLGNVFGECYLAHAPLDGSNNYTLQTVRDRDFKTLCSRIGAPDMCRNEWSALFGPWIAREVDKRAVANAAQPAAEADKKE